VAELQIRRSLREEEYCVAEVPETLEGWYALHDFRALDWASWQSSTGREGAVEELTGWLAGVESPEKGGSALFTVAGHRADMMVLHLRPSIDELIVLEKSLSQTRVGPYLRQTYSYLSVTELSLYEAYARGGTEDPAALMQQPFVQKRLYFDIPEMRYCCFYPMNKRRGEVVNWYAAEMEERRRMMREHGSTGRKYHGRVTQMITGSTGLDDWEWGVTLFAHDPLDIKKLVYEMRFDEVSAKYGEFGPFYMGVRAGEEELSRYLGSGEV
jgi:hydrogen peroxide-dependent heme synthase